MFACESDFSFYCLKKSFFLFLFCSSVWLCAREKKEPNAGGVATAMVFGPGFRTWLE